MAIRTVVTEGYGNGTFDGTIALLVTSGYAIAVGIASFTKTIDLVGKYNPEEDLIGQFQQAESLIGRHQTDMDLTGGI